MPIALRCLGKTKFVPRASERRTIGYRQIGSATTMRGPFPQRFCREQCPDSCRAKTSGTGCHRNAARGEVCRLGNEILFCGFFERPKISARLRGNAPASALPDRSDLGWSRSIKKMDRGKKTGDLRDDFINVLGCRGIKVFDEVAWLEAAAFEFGRILILDPCVSLKSSPAVPAARSRGYIILCNITYITSCQFLVSISMRI